MITDVGTFILYLFYGLAFFIVGAAISSRNLRHSDLKMARVLWIFSLFAYLHGMNEWFELFLKINPPSLQSQFYASGQIFVLGLSFAFLLWYGLEMLRINRPQRQQRWVIWLMVVTLPLAATSVAHLWGNYGLIDLLLRNLVALPGAAFSGWGLIRYAATKEVLNPPGAKNLAHAGRAILLYGIFAGILPSGLQLGGIPIELLRAFAALLILLGIMRALQLFDDERQQKIEKSLKRFAQSEKMVSLGKLSAGIAHEINNPLSNVLLNIEMLEKELQHSSPIAASLQGRIDAIKRNQDRAAKIASELLSFSHNRNTAFVPIDLNEIIQKTFRLIGSRCDIYDFKLDLEKIPQIEGIPWKIEEVLLNILMNAMEATSPSGVIEVTTRVEGKNLFCSVTDQGSGIRQEDLDFVLDPFFTTKEPGKGTGLGLSICFGIMELHGGEIEVKSQQHEGTSVKLLFPLRESVKQ